MKNKKHTFMPVIVIIIVSIGIIHDVSYMIVEEHIDGKTRYMFSRNIWFYSRNIRHYENVANYMLENISYFDYSFVRPETGQVFEPGDVKRWQDIHMKPNGEYIATVYDVEESKKTWSPFEEVYLNDLPAKVSRSLDKLFHGRVESAEVYVYPDKPIRLSFVQDGENMIDRQIIMYFPDYEPNLRFEYEVITLKRENWYYIDYGNEW